MRTVSILGSTGSVGQSTLDVMAAHPGAYDIQVLTAGTKVSELAAQAKRFRPKRAVIRDERLYGELKSALSGTGIDVAAGDEAVVDAGAMDADWTMCAIVGMAGLKPIMAALARGKYVAVANKEPLVAAGPMVMAAARESGAILLPVDSEHSAIFQVFEAQNRAQISRLILTASGGPLRSWTKDKMETAPIADVLAHPNWTMGPKISVDSASMMNKALEVIEAHYLFAMPADKIDVLVHPQSIVHSMVEYADGSVLSQMGLPDMRTPIAVALAWPKRMDAPAPRLDFSSIQPLSFEPVNHELFPAVKMAYGALSAGQGACISLNAANEVAVEAFLGARIPFGEISRVARRALDLAPRGNISTIEDVFAVDCEVRELVSSQLNSFETSNRKAS